MVGRYYAGIGNRIIDTPNYWQSLICEVVELLYGKGFILRSGGAEGADSMFEKYAGNQKEIYLPFKGFNNSDSELYYISEKSKQMAIKHHPLGDRLSSTILNFHARNCYQILGYDLDLPVEFVICICKDITSGGTSQALRLAESYGIPIYNLYDMDDGQLIKFWEYLKTL